MKYLTKEQVIYLHKQLIQEFGGMEGIRKEEVDLIRQMLKPNNQL